MDLYGIKVLENLYQSNGGLKSEISYGGGCKRRDLRNYY